MKNQKADVMRKYDVKTRFSFSGTFFITANNKDEAKDIAEKHCGLVLGGKIHSPLSGDVLDWDFQMHPDITIGRICINREQEANYA